MSLAVRLNELRVKKKKSLQEVADALGVSKTHVWELEKNRTDNPSLELLTKMSNYFKVSIRHLIGEDFENSQEDELARMFRQVGDLEDNERAIVDDMIQSLRARRREADDKNRSDGN
ncbi:helix-turn-helix transcriptional regulator [Pseudosulfitobacter sp. DSM 107133]|uniref:helix-turn-helix domain-containing protein n=1 Tax=Pseudosulfitobacter sp. DSM 107133 TaxID=2883100 RepID=UPI000DF42218|nr:helix-turn-helix transcriptional regulator [Pseudosulfitobacter sp. DSM 107133]UOA30230.1 HTH-type transcriptional regulator SinR [Pseudosulfitobacter sp. DSM 107133]